MLLRRGELLKVPELFRYYSIEGIEKHIELEKGTLAFTCCQVPIIYHVARDQKIRITMSDGNEQEIYRLSLEESVSASVFNRRGEIERIDVFLTLGQEKK